MAWGQKKVKGINLEDGGAVSFCDPVEGAVDFAPPGGPGGPPLKRF